MKWLALFAALQAALFAAVFGWARMPSFVPLDDGQRQQIFAALREGGAAAGWDGPLVVQLWEKGRPQLRIEAPSLAGAVRQFAAARDQPGRLSVDLVRGRAPLPRWIVDRWPLGFALSLVPGRDALALFADGKEALLLPSDLLLAGALGGEHPMPELDLDVGIDVGRVLTLAFDRLGIGGGRYETLPHRWSRVRVESFAEEDAAPPELTRARLFEAARAAGDYLVRHLGADGRYDYLYDPVNDRADRDNYSLPRHAGTTYFLAQLHGATHDPAHRDAAGRALEYLQKKRRQRGSLGEGATVELGSAALALVAAAEYQRTSGDARFAPWMRELASFLVYMQLPSGDYRHYYQPGIDRRDEISRAPYYSGEASLALARYAALLPAHDAAPYAAAAERGVDYLVGPYYDFFLGQFLFSEDHWTCMAADTLSQRVSPDKLRRYARFCDHFAAFLRRMQYTPADGITRARPEFSGAYGFGPALPGHSTPAGSRSECALSVLRLNQRAGLPTDEVREQLRLSMQFLLARQFRGDDHRFPNPSAAIGGIPQSDVNLSVRIDGVQHVGSALLRASEVW